jgi:hypothetical protein
VDLSEIQGGSFRDPGVDLSEIPHKLTNLEVNQIEEKDPPIVPQKFEEEKRGEDLNFEFSRSEVFKDADENQAVEVEVLISSQDLGEDQFAAVDEKFNATRKYEDEIDARSQKNELQKRLAATGVRFLENRRWKWEEGFLEFIIQRLQRTSHYNRIPRITPTLNNAKQHCNSLYNSKNNFQFEDLVGKAEDYASNPKSGGNDSAIAVNSSSGLEKFLEHWDNEQ